MSGFIPDLAGWALRGGAGSNQDDDNNGNQDNNNNEAQGETMSPEELRAQRLARLELMQQQQQQQQQQAAQQQQEQEQQQQEEPVPMEVDAPEKEKETPKAKATPAPSPKSDTMEVEKPNPQKQKKAKSEKETVVLDPERKLQRRKELLLKKVLQIVLEGSHIASVTSTDTSISSSPTLLDTGSTDISVQSIAEILACRLAMDPPSASAAVTMQQQTLIAYLGASHRRASEEVKTIQQSTKKAQFADEMIEILQEIQRQVVSYAATCLMEPDLFPLAKDSTAQLAKCLLHGTGGATINPSENTSISFSVTGSSTGSFYYLLIEELLQQDASVLGSTIVPAVVQYFMNLLKKSENILDHGGSAADAASPVIVVTALKTLCTHKSVAEAVAKLPSFNLPPANSPQAKEVVTPPLPNPGAGTNPLQMLLANSNPDNKPYLKRSGPGLEKDTLLGLCLRIGIPSSRTGMQSNPAFPASNILRTSLHSLEQASAQQRSQLQVHQTACYQLIMALIKGSPKARELVMQWFQDALQVNVGASGLRPDPTKVSSTNLLLNTSVMLLKLCEPFVNDEKKQHLIDPGFVSSPKDHGGVFETVGDDAVVRLGSDNNPEAKKEYKPKNSFIPQCFFYCARSLHLGLVPALSSHENLLRHINHFHWQLTSSNRDLQSEPRFAMMIARQRSDEVALYQEDMVSDTLRFCNLIARVMFAMEDDLLRTMPEDFVSDICDTINTIAKLNAKLLRGHDFRYVFKLIVKLLSSKYAHMVRNYNLRAMLGDVLYEVFLPTTSGDRRDVPSSVASDPSAGGQTFLLSDSDAQETLAPSLLLLYGEVEHTGYYDKMSHRAKISSLIKYLWESSEHRPAFRRITQNKASFIKFANGMMNETNTLIATVMQKLPEIREAQQKMKNVQEWSRLSEEEQEQVSSRLEENEREVKHALPLCNKTLQMFGYLNTDEEIRSLFNLDELCPRLVTMLIHVLTKLVGSKGLDLKVDNPEQYEFRPKEMLRDLCAIFALFATSTNFQDECAKSGADPTLLRSAVKTCRKLNLLTGESMAAFESLPEIVESAGQRVAADEELLQGAPDEFLDELMATYMKDPVILPSGHFVDRSTITQHLLNDPIDPFNREPMTIDDVEPATDLKKRMNAWLEERRAANAKGSG